MVCSSLTSWAVARSKLDFSVARCRARRHFLVSLQRVVGHVAARFRCCFGFVDHPNAKGREVVVEEVNEVV